MCSARTGKGSTWVTPFRLRPSCDTKGAEHRGRVKNVKNRQRLWIIHSLQVEFRKGKPKIICGKIILYAGFSGLKKCLTYFTLDYPYVMFKFLLWPVTRSIPIEKKCDKYPFTGSPSELRFVWATCVPYRIDHLLPPDSPYLPIKAVVTKV